MAKKSIIGIQARNKAIKGMEYLAGKDGIVRNSLGPSGMNGWYDKGGIQTTNDGFTLSKEYCEGIKDEFERAGARMIHHASSKTNDQVGDATTTSEVLSYEVILEAVKYLPQEGLVASKKKPSEIVQQINKEKEFVIVELEKGVKQIESEEELINSAKVSVEDDELADLIGKAQWKIGKDGMIIAEETAEYKSDIEYVKGIKFDNGYGTSMVINNPEKGTLEVKDAQVIMTNNVIQTLQPLLSIMNELSASGKKDLIIIGRAFSEKAIGECKANFDVGFRVYPINAPYTNQKEIMLDLEAVLGGKYIDSEGGMKLEDINMDCVGFASKIIAKRFDAVIAGTDDEGIIGELQKERVKNRLADLKKSLKGSVSEFEKKMTQARISQLQNGFAILKVGAETDVDRQRKKDKCDDAVNAVRLAYQGGTVKGAGLAFKEIADKMDNDSLLKRPLMSIYNQIILSSPAGFTVPDWCRDPYLVLKAALTNACSVAGTFASVNGIVCTTNQHNCQCAKSIEEDA